MNKYLKIFIGTLLFSIFLTKDKICQHLGFGQEKMHEQITIPEEAEAEIHFQPMEPSQQDSFVDETIFNWDDTLMDWVIAPDDQPLQSRVVNYNSKGASSLKPLEISWETLMNIQYRLKYFAQIDMEMYAPVFPEEVETLHEKEVIIEGFVIPFEAEEEILSLSYFPYASCFFCGKASPASVISMYMKKGSKNYKIDDFKKFKGVLHLNYDDPNEFYYILKNAEEV